MWNPTLPPFRKFKEKTYTDLIATSKFIYQIGEAPMLRQKSNPVDLRQLKSEDFKKKVTYLKRCIRRYRKLTGVGRGITAVQVGIPERYSVIYIPEMREELLTIINPKIMKRSDKKLIYPEMCMSANPAIAPVIRAAWIEFEYYDEAGKKQTWNMKADDKLGMMYNRVFQHEIDHMDGIINIDLVQSKDIIFESDPEFYKRAEFVEV